MLAPPRPQSQSEPLAYKPTDAAAIIGLSRATIYKLIEDGSLPSLRIGGRILVRREALIDFLDKMQAAS